MLLEYQTWDRTWLIQRTAELCVHVRQPRYRHQRRCRSTQWQAPGPDRHNQRPSSRPPSSLHKFLCRSDFVSATTSARSTKLAISWRGCWLRARRRLLAPRRRARAVLSSLQRLAPTQPAPDAIRMVVSQKPEVSALQVQHTNWTSRLPISMSLKHQTGNRAWQIQRTPENDCFRE